jgi:type VI secretion system protein VasD
MDQDDRGEIDWRRDAGRLSRRGVLLLGTAALASCSWLFGKKDEEKKPEPKEAAMKPPPGAKLEITVAASPLINPDLDGRPSPVVVRFYQLGSEEAFKQADFTQLYESDEKTLGKSLLGKLDTILPPGGIQVFSIAKVNPETTFIGVVVGFRKFDGAKWRADYAMQGKSETKIRCNISHLAVELKADDS